MLSGLEKYIYSKIQGLAFCLGNGFILSKPFLFITTISPFSTSLTKSAPMISRAHVLKQVYMNHSIFQLQEV